MEKVYKNLSDIERKLTKSNKIVSKGEKLSLGDAIKLGRKSNSIVSTIRKGTEEYTRVTPSDDEAQKTLVVMQSVVALTETQLTLLVGNKPTFDKLHVAGLVKKNIEKSREASMGLSKLMLEKAPAHIKPEAEALEKRRAAAFTKAVDTFANATGGEDQADGEDDSE
ncbi:hypothetical protein BKA65DRAFT_560073 [Rhexocercosporidium sp. MPI-PUGE-AT-0058]|nr:hypothetical protein BKA65DRAFT_560073 [Rhexocercosporidium sp. MPI-PUGE-AT-0058]